MYSAYVYDYTQSTVTPICFYTSASSDSRLALSGAKLSLKKNEAGSLGFKMYPNNVGYDYFKTLTSVIEVKKDNQPYWRGRVISEEQDAYNNRTITCEGSLNFLLDSVQLPMHVHSGILTWIQYLLTTDYHDSEAPEGQYHRCHNYYYASNDTYKRFAIKYFDPNIELSEPTDWYANYETTGELLKNVLDAYDIKMEVTYENGINNLSFYKDYPAQYISQQTITFGKNLISFTRNWEVDELATVVIPTGSKLDAGSERPTYPYTPPELDCVTTIESVNQGSVFLEADADVIARYGRIYKKIDWSDIAEPANLLDLAQNYLQNYQFDGMTIEIEVFDLSLMMTGGERAANELKLLGTVHCVSQFHGLDKTFPITEMEIDFNNPGNTKFVLGEATDTSLTGTMESSNNAVYKAIDVHSSSASEVYNSVEGGIDDKLSNYSTLDETQQAIDTSLEDYSTTTETAQTIHDSIVQNCYTKSETYSKSEVWNKSEAYSKSDTYSKSETYSKDEAYAKSEVYNKSQTDSQAAAAAETYYTNHITGDLTTATSNAVQQAGQNATAMITSFGVGSYVIFVHDPNDTTGQKIKEIVISNNTNYTANTAHVWRWNSGGLGYSSTGYNGTYSTAITADGAISANFITSGSMSAARITSGTMSADRISGGTIQSTDEDASHRHNMVLNLTNGHFFAKNLFVETPSTVLCPSDGYIYLGTGDWSQNSIWSNGSNTISVAGYIEHNWRCILGSHFGVTSDGVVACDYMKAGVVLIGGDFLRTVKENTVLGNSGTFLLAGTNSGTLFNTEGTYAVAGVSRSDWRLTVGNNFGVTSEGILYSNQGVFTSAHVDGTVDAAVFSAFTMSYGNTSQYFGSYVTQNDAITSSRRIVLKVSSYGTSGGYPVCTVSAWTEGTGGNQLNNDVRVQFYIGTFDNVGSGPYNKQHFVFSTYTVFELTIPAAGRTSSNPVTKSCQGQSNSYGAFACRAIYIKSNWDSGSATTQIYGNPAADGFSDCLNTQYVTSGTQHNAIQFNCSLAPIEQMSGQELLGGISNMWKQLYATSASIYTSARSKKYDITKLQDNFDIFFDQLNPVSFRMKNDDDKRKHNGFVLDEVAQALAIAHIPKEDFAGYEIFDKQNPLGDGGLRYSEFIAINTQQIQKLKKRVSELEKLVEELERNKNENST